MTGMDLDRNRDRDNARQTSATPSHQVTGPRSDSAAGPVRTSEQIQRAISEFDEEESLPPVPDHPDLINVLLRNATLLVANGEQRLAINILRNVLLRNPSHPEGLRRMGACLRDCGRNEEALKCFRALAKITKDADAQALVAETLYLMERDGAALEAYREVMKSVISDETKLFEVYKNVGNIHVRSGDLDAAEEFYVKAHGLNPRSDVLMVNFGTLEIQRENVSEAVERFRGAVEINPENDKAWVGLAIVHRQMGDLELAWGNIERALDINRANRTAIRLLVEWAGAAQMWRSAIPRLQEYLEIEGEDAEMAFVLAKVFTQVGQLREARLEMERVLALDPAIEGGEALMSALDAELARQVQAGSERS